MSAFDQKQHIRSKPLFKGSLFQFVWILYRLFPVFGTGAWVAAWRGISAEMLAGTMSRRRKAINGA
jgi:hypothetical protein